MADEWFAPFPKGNSPTYMLDFRLFQWYSWGLFFWVVVLVAGVLIFKVWNVHQPIKIRKWGYHAISKHWATITSTHWTKGWVGPTKQTNLLRLLGMESWFLGHPAHSPVTTPPELPQLFITCLWIWPLIQNILFRPSSKLTMFQSITLNCMVYSSFTKTSWPNVQN